MKTKGNFTPLQKAARELIRREMHEYDAMSQPAKIRFEHNVAETNDTPYDAGERRCAHGVLFHQPCEKCTRTIEDCKVYEVAMLFRIKELLKDLS